MNSVPTAGQTGFQILQRRPWAAEGALDPKTLNPISSFHAGSDPREPVWKGLQDTGVYFHQVCASGLSRETEPIGERDKGREGETGVGVNYKEPVHVVMESGSAGQVAKLETPVSQC